MGISAFLLALLMFFAHPAYSAEVPKEGEKTFHWEYYSAKERDKIALPGAVMRLIKIKPGSIIVDVDPAAGYWTFRFARAVGPKGKVYGIQVCPSINEEMDKYALRETSNKRLNPYNNVEFLKRPQDNIGFEPGSVDMVFLSLCGFLLGDPADMASSDMNIYHDQCAPMDTKLMQSIFVALKPGGKLVIIDLLETPLVIKYRKEGLRRARSAEIVRENYRKLGFRPVAEYGIFKGDKYVKDVKAFALSSFFKDMPEEEKPTFDSEKFFLILEKPTDSESGK